MLSSLTKSTYPLFETICILEGKVQNKEFHIERFRTSFEKFYWARPVYGLFDGLQVPEKYLKGRIKLRISYNQTEKNVSFETYQKKIVQSLKVVHHDNIDYDLKFQDRTPLNKLFGYKGDCDDILIVKKGLVTDSFYANIIFFDGFSWHCPKSYLLKGTKRTQLLKDRKIGEMDIRFEDIINFKGFQLINAMLDFKDDLFFPIQNIRR